MAETVAVAGTEREEGGSEVGGRGQWRPVEDWEVPGGDQSG